MSMFGMMEAAKGIGAELIGVDAAVSGVSSDTRKLAENDLFVALRGDRFDGHAFLAQAQAAGVAAVMVDRAYLAQQERPSLEVPMLVVDDTRLGLGRLAHWWRHQFKTPLVAITGSNGKTTVKEMVTAILSAQTQDRDQVLATAGNLNNDIGMPLTLLGLRDSHRFGVLEMGMNHPGEISYLTRIARPNVAMINNAHAAHLAGLGTVEAVAHAKGEIYEGLADDGVAIINADDPQNPLWRQLVGGRHLLTFGLEAAADISATFKLNVLDSQVTLKTPQGTVALVLPVPGLHNVRNACAATAVACALGIDLSVIQAGLSSFQGVKGRLQKKSGKGGALLLDDTYNANPDSVRAAIAVLAAAPGRRGIVLGDMGELGPDAARIHGQIGAQARSAGIDALFALGDLSREAVKQFGANAYHFDQLEALVAAVEAWLAPDATVLIKGSRFMQMERVVKNLERSGS